MTITQRKFSKATSFETFRNVSILLPVVNETVALQETVRLILESCDSRDLQEFIVIVCERTFKASLDVCQRLQSDSPIPFRVHHQALPFLGGAIQEGFRLAEGSHIVMMASDLETDPALVRELIASSKAHPDSIVTASRWMQQARFHGYNKVKLVLNFVFQKIFSWLYATSLSDLTYGYRLFPRKLVQKITWEETRHPFFLETILKPLRLGVPVIELPARWTARTEGESQNTFWRNFEYFRIGLAVRLQPVNRWFKEWEPSN